MPKVVDLEELLTATAAGKQRPRPRADVVRGAGGRHRTVGLTVHVPPEVRDQLKVLAIEKQTTVHKLVCQALNDLFAAEHRPEIAR